MLSFLPFPRNCMEFLGIASLEKENAGSCSQGAGTLLNNTQTHWGREKPLLDIGSFKRKKKIRKQNILKEINGCTKLLVRFCIPKPSEFRSHFT